MKKIYINYSGNLVENIVKRYLAYKFYVKYYEKDSAESIEFVNDPDGIPCFWYDDDLMINQHKSKIIFIEVPTEGIHKIDVFRCYAPDKKYYIISNGWWDIDKWELGIDYELVPWVETLYQYQEQIVNAQYVNYYVDKTYQYGIKPYLFCSTIGNTNPYRDLLVSEIQQNIKDSKFIMNYAGQQLGQNSRHWDVDYNFDNYDSYEPFLQSNGIPYNISQTIPINMYNQCYFNLIVESNLGVPNEFHLSEKTLKPIMTGMPFVMAGGAGYLTHLHKLGFRTFSDLWSEEYDTIENLQDRIKEIVKLTQTLATFDWEKHQARLIEITNFNKMHMAYNNAFMISQLKNFERIMEKIS
jgi:hypothetical protein